MKILNKIRKFDEFVAFTLVLLATAGTIGVIFFYESLQAKKRNAIELEAHPISTWSKKEIRVKKGEIVRIRIINKDTVTHGFAIPELDVEDRIIHPGQNVIVEFVPKWEGEYLYKCVVQCDRKLHEFMTGKLIVEE